MSISEIYFRTPKRKKKIFAFFTAIMLFFMLGQIVGFAEESDKIDSQYIRSLVQVRTGYNDIIRKAEFSVLKFLSQTIDYFQESVDKLVEMNLYDFVKDKFSTDTVYPLAWALFSFTLIIVGIIFIWNNDKIRLSDSAKSIFMSALIIIALPSFFSALGEMKIQGKNDVYGIFTGSSGNKFTLGENMLMKSMVYLPGSTTDKYGNIDFQTYDEMDIANLDDATPGEVGTKTTEAMNNLYKVYNNVASVKDIRYYYDGNNKAELHGVQSDNDEIENFRILIKTLGYDTELAYSYYIDFWYNLVLMCVTIVCLIFAGIKLAGLLFNLMFLQIISPLIAATDLNGAGRAKKIVQNILSTYIVFIIVYLVLYLYLIVMQGLRASTDVNFATTIMITIAGAKFVIDGPDIVVQILGIDAGVKSGAATLMGLHSAAQMASGAAKGTANAVRNVAAVPAKVGAAVGKAGAAAKSIHSAPAGVGSKVGAAIGNTSAGQAFKQAYAGQNQTNESFKEASAKAAPPQNMPKNSENIQNSSNNSEQSKQDNSSNGGQLNKNDETGGNSVNKSPDNKSDTSATPAKSGTAFSDSGSLKNSQNTGGGENVPFAQAEIKSEMSHETYADEMIKEENNTGAFTAATPEAVNTDNMEMSTNKSAEALPSGSENKQTYDANSGSSDSVGGNKAANVTQSAQPAAFNNVSKSSGGSHPVNTNNAAPAVTTSSSSSTSSSPVQTTSQAVTSAAFKESGNTYENVQSTANVQSVPFAQSEINSEKQRETFAGKLIKEEKPNGHDTKKD